jgi:GxxExxY protein
MDVNTLSNKVIGMAIEVHKALGPGLLESAYCECLRYEIYNYGLNVEIQKPSPIIYKYSD